MTFQTIPMLLEANLKPNKMPKTVANLGLEADSANVRRLVQPNNENSLQWKQMQGLFVARVRGLLQKKQGHFAIIIIFIMGVINQIKIIFVILTSLLITSQLIYQDKEISLIIQKWSINRSHQNQPFSRILSDKPKQAAQNLSIPDDHRSQLNPNGSYLEQLIYQMIQNETQQLKQSNSGEKSAFKKDQTALTQKIYRQNQKKGENGTRSYSTQLIAQNKLAQIQKKKKDSQPKPQPTTISPLPLNTESQTGQQQTESKNVEPKTKNSLTIKNTIQISQQPKKKEDGEYFGKKYEKVTQDKLDHLKPQNHNGSLTPRQHHNSSWLSNGTSSKDTNLTKNSSYSIQADSTRTNQTSAKQALPSQISNENPTILLIQNTNKTLMAIIVFQSLIIVLLLSILICVLFNKKLKVGNLRAQQNINQDPISTNRNFLKTNT